MPLGEGRYNTECELIHKITGGIVVILIVIKGNKGSGFSLIATEDKYTEDKKFLLSTCDVLEDVASEIRKDFKSLQK